MAIKRFFQQLYLSKRFFFVMLGVMALFVFAYVFKDLLEIAWMTLWLVLGLTFMETLVLFFSGGKITIDRKLPERLSNGDDNVIHLSIFNSFGMKIFAQVIDELPFQFQTRDFEHHIVLRAKDKHEMKYRLRPTVRGVYEFGAAHVFTTTFLGLAQRRFSGAEKQSLKCYPAFLQLRNTDIRAIANDTIVLGTRKTRRIGNSTEFEQIREYVQGDDIRTINWKSSAKRSYLMVNQYEEEKSQDIYVAIDTGRTMEMPFDGISLLDYSINASLMLLSLTLAKYDRAGMFSFNKRMNNVIPADKKPMQMQQIMESLYAVETEFYESNFAALYAQLKRTISHRSLIVLFTNFESMDGMQRNLPFLAGINKKHLLLVVFFKNKEIEELAASKPTTEDEWAEKIMAGKMEYDKRLMVREMKQHGIISLLTTPENLTVDVMNKYLEVKTGGMI